MINSIHSNYNNPLANIQPKISKDSNQTTTSNASNLASSKDVSKDSTNKVLGYAVDSDGYFTEEFNKAAGIPSDYKIHSSSLESLVRVETNPLKHEMVKEFKSIDIAKTIGNAYKILSQVVGEDVLNSKDSFTLEEIAKFPQGYEYHRQTMQVSKLHNTSFDFVNAEAQFHYDNDEDIFLNQLFFNTAESRLRGVSATDIFNSNNGGAESTDYGTFFNSYGSKYTNSDGSITKGGLLIAVINANSYTKEGEATRWGQRQGFDKSMNRAEVKEIWERGNTVLKLQERSEESLRVDKEWEEYVKNYKDPLTMFFEGLQEQQKLSFEELERKRKELRAKNIKDLDIDV